jgi:hypothetical protein
MTLPLSNGPRHGRLPGPQWLGALACRKLAGVAAALRPGRYGSAKTPPPPAEPTTPAAWPKSSDLIDPD